MGTLLSFGSMVQKGKFSAAAWLFVSTLKNVDFLKMKTAVRKSHQGPGGVVLRRRGYFGSTAASSRRTRPRLCRESEQNIRTLTSKNTLPNYKVR